MLFIIIICVIAALIYFPTRNRNGKQAALGMKHLKNIKNLEPNVQKVLESWVRELDEDIKTEDLENIDNEAILRFVGVKIKQNIYTKELGAGFKE